MALLVRPVRLDEAEAVLRVLHAAHAWNMANGFNFTAADMPLDALMPRLRPERFFVAVDGETVLGTIEVQPEEAPGEWRFHLLAVAPEATGLGVGKALVGFAEAFAKEQGAERLTLDTPETHPWLPAFYGRLGFRIYDTVQWQGKNYRSVLMEKALNIVVGA
jgi:GNAT superfamily N-acetyltransferase